MSASVAFLLVIGCSAASAAPVATSTKADADDVCTWLSAADFTSAGLTEGKPKRETGPTGPGCTWDFVLGKGGFLHVELTSLSAYEKRKERGTKDGKLIAVSGFGDEAFLTSALVGQLLYIKKGQRAVRIDGNAQLDRAKLEPLGRAVLQHM